jgi:MOSC domain-containing protein YiiM
VPPISSEPTVVAMFVGLPAERQDLIRERSFRTGFWKEQTSERRWLSLLNLDGDGQADLVHHGGVDKALLVYAATHYPQWREELPEQRMGPGAFGENLTVDGLDEGAVCIGDTWRVGGAVVQVTQARRPCWKLEARWNLPGLLHRTEVSGRTGWYHRVVEEGLVGAGDPLTLVDRPHPAWTVERASTVILDVDAAIEPIAALAALPELSSSWQRTLRARLAGVAEDPTARRGA